MTITNKIPRSGQFVLSADENWVDSEILRYKRDRINKNNMQNYQPEAVLSEDDLASQLQ